MKKDILYTILLGHDNKEMWSTKFALLNKETHLYFHSTIINAIYSEHKFEKPILDHYGMHQCTVQKKTKHLLPCIWFVIIQVMIDQVNIPWMEWRNSTLLYNASNNDCFSESACAWLYIKNKVKPERKMNKLIYRFCLDHLWFM